MIRAETEAIRLLVVIKLTEAQAFKLSHFETLKRNVTYSRSQNYGVLQFEHSYLDWVVLEANVFNLSTDF